MHDLDRTQREFASALHELQPEQFEFPGEEEVLGEAAAESALHEAGLHEAASYEGAYETGQETQEGSVQEAQEMELAAELLEVTNEQELDRFLGGLFRKIGGFVGKLVPAPIGRALGGILKPLAKVALPIAGRAFGTFFGGPVGGMVGGRLASAAGRMFGLELEGLSAEDREFEVARRFVRFASTAAKSALTAPPTANPQAVARGSVIAAARRLAPGLMTMAAPAYYTEPDYAVPIEPIAAGARRRGIWVRRGHRIIVYGA
jgi:hypothetical protein